MERKIWRDFDFVLLGATLALTGLGIATIHSATINSSGLEEVTSRQAIYALVGLVLMLAVATFDYNALENMAGLTYGLMIASLVIVFVVGEITHGSRRWIDLGPFPLQPSELAKVLTVIVLSKFFSHRAEEGWHFWHFLLSFLIIAPPAMLIYLEPDLGTAVVLLVVWVGMSLAAGMKLLHLGIAGGLALLSLPLLWNALRGYMQHRIISFLFPSLDPMGMGYNLHQALIAIGSGGLLGKGFASGSQSQLHFLRVRHTDFVFSVLAEELGLVGVFILFGLIILILWRTLRAARLARDSFGYFLAWGMAVILFFQSFVSIGMNLGLMPTTGIPLPFICYGGSSLITFLLGQGLVQSVVMRHRRPDFQQEP